MKVYAGTFSQPGTSYLLLRGDPTKKGPAVSPAAVRVSRFRLLSTLNRPRHPDRAPRAWIADRQSAAGEGDSQSSLALPLRPRDRGHAERLRL